MASLRILHTRDTIILRYHPDKVCTNIINNVSVLSYHTMNESYTAQRSHNN